MISHQLLTVIDDFCDRLILDANGPENAREYLLQDEIPIEARNKASSLVSRMLKGQKDILGKHNVKQPGERYIKEVLLWPLLDTLGYEIRIESFLGQSDKQADFRFINTKRLVIGECKSPNKYEKAIQDVRDNILNADYDPEYAVVTDGFNWMFITFPEPITKTTQPEIIESHDIRGVIGSRMEFKGCMKNQRDISNGLRKSSVMTANKYEYDSTINLEEFSEKFGINNINQIIRERQ